MNATRRRTGIGVMIAIVIVALVAACQATGIRDKTGGDTTVLKLVTFEGHVDDNGQNYGLRRSSTTSARYPGAASKSTS